MLTQRTPASDLGGPVTSDPFLSSTTAVSIRTRPAHMSMTQLTERSRRALSPCGNFLHGFKGGPSARQAPGQRPGSKQGTRSHRAGCVTEVGTTPRTRAGEWGYCPTPGRRPRRAPSGGSPAGAPPPPGRAAPLPQVGGPRRNAASMVAPAKGGPGPSSVPGILSPCKTSAPIGWTGQTEPHRPHVCACQAAIDGIRTSAERATLVPERTENGRHRQSLTGLENGL